MPDVAIGDIISINLDGRLFNQQVILTTHWRIFNLTGGSVVDMSALFTAWSTELGSIGELYDTYSAATSESLVLIKGIFQKIYPDRWIKFSFMSSQPSGVIAEPSLPPNVSHVITLRGDAANPHSRGNKHITAVPPSFTEDGSPTAPALTAYTDLANSMDQAITFAVGGVTVNAEPIIYNRALPINSVLVTNHILGGTTRVERRRTVGLGS